jgi:alpha-N-arabinofuranosidase
MAQGTRVTCNLIHDNGPWEDLFMEVDHGPFMVDNNLFLSPTALLDVSEGGAYVHNLFAGRTVVSPEPNRETPYHKAHSTEVAGLKNIQGGDNRFYNNVFVGHNGLSPYDREGLMPVQMAGNVFVSGASACKHEQSPLVAAQFDPGIKLIEEKDSASLQITLDKWAEGKEHPLVTTELLGKAKIPDLPYEQPDGSPYRIDTDYFGKKRNAANPFPGPFELPAGGKQELKLWPVGKQ